MAKKKADTTSKIKDFLTGLATDPMKLGKFILDPDGEMDAAKIPAKDRAHIKAGIVHLVHDKLAKPPDAYFIM